MPSSPTTRAERYLDVLRTLGVTDGAIRRFHAVESSASLEARLATALDAPTDDLLRLLTAAGVVVDLEEVAPVDADRLSLSLARFGYLVECTAVGDDLEIVGFDAVTEDVEHLRVEPDREALQAALSERLLGPDDVAVETLVDGRTLLADRRALDALCDRYGPRLEPFETPLLATGREPVRSTTPPMIAETPADPTEVSVSIDVPTEAVEDGRVEAGDGESTSSSAKAGDAATPDRSEAGSVGAAASSEEGTPVVAADDPAVDDPADDGPAVDEVLASADEETAEAIEDTLTESGTRVHTADGTDEDVTKARDSGVGGGPRRTVSTAGIDEVFAELEAAAPGTPMEGSDDMDDETDSSGAPDDGPDDGLAGAGPSRTVSETSADDILQRATGNSDFEELAESEADADPAAVLEDADGVPDVDPTQGVASSDAETDTPPAAPADDGTDGAADEVPASGDGAGDARPAADSADDPPIETAETSVDEDGRATRRSDASRADDPDGSDPDQSAPTSDGGRPTSTLQDSSRLAAISDDPPIEFTSEDGSVDDDAAESETAESEAADGDVSTPDDETTSDPVDDDTSAPETSSASRDTASSTDVDEASASLADLSSDRTEDVSALGDDDSDTERDDSAPSEATTEDEPSATSRTEGTGLGDELVAEDAEIRKGTETLDVDPTDYIDGDPDRADGPLATSGGVTPAASAGSMDGSDGDAPRENANDEPSDDAATTDESGGILARLRSFVGF